MSIILPMTYDDIRKTIKVDKQLDVSSNKPYLSFWSSRGKLGYETLLCEIHNWALENNITYSLEYSDDMYRPINIIFDNKNNALLFKLSWMGK